MSVLALDIYEACGTCGRYLTQFTNTLWHHVTGFLLFNKVAVEVVPKEVSTEEISSVKERLQQLRKDHKPDPPTRRIQFYNSVKKKFGFAVWVNPNTVYITNNGDIEDSTEPFPHTKLNIDIAESFLILDEHEHIDSLAIFNEIREVLKRYLYCKDERLFTFYALWIMQTYLYQCFNYCGYIHLHSEDVAMGKTLTLEVLSMLSYECVRPTNTPSSAFIRAFAERGGTNIYDTLERWRSSDPKKFEESMNNLDAGFRHGGTVALMVGSQNSGRWRPNFVKVYGPYMLAGIDRNSLGDTAQDRSFSIETFPKPHELDLPDLFYEDAHAECEEIRKSLYLWALRNAVEIADDYRANQHRLKPLQIKNRGADIWKPLFAIMKNLGLSGSQEWRDMELLAIEQHRDAMVKKLEQEHKILQVLRSRDCLKATNTQIQNLLKQNNILMSQQGVTDLMKSWGIPSKKLRPSAGLEPDLSLKKAKDGSVQAVDGYELSADDLKRLSEKLKPIVLSSATGTTTTTEKEQVN